MHKLQKNAREVMREGKEEEERGMNENMRYAHDLCALSQISSRFYGIRTSSQSAVTHVIQPVRQMSKEGIAQLRR